MCEHRAGRTKTCRVTIPVDKDQVGNRAAPEDTQRIYTLEAKLKGGVKTG